MREIGSWWQEFLDNNRVGWSVERKRTMEYIRHMKLDFILSPHFILYLIFILNPPDDEYPLSSAPPIRLDDEMICFDGRKWKILQLLLTPESRICLSKRYSSIGKEVLRLELAIRKGDGFGRVLRSNISQIPCIHSEDAVRKEFHIINFLGEYLTLRFCFMRVVSFSILQSVCGAQRWVPQGLPIPGKPRDECIVGILCDGQVLCCRIPRRGIQCW